MRQTIVFLLIAAFSATCQSNSANHADVNKSASNAAKSANIQTVSTPASGIKTGQGEGIVTKINLEQGFSRA